MQSLTLIFLFLNSSSFLVFLIHKSIGAGAATIASAGAAIGIGNVFSSLIHSVARNPSLAKQSFGYAILGFALTEAIASFAPMMAFLISSVFRSRFYFNSSHCRYNLGFTVILLIVCFFFRVPLYSFSAGHYVLVVARLPSFSHFGKI
jgi:F-type H+-transporting ATPase subunit c